MTSKIDLHIHSKYSPDADLSLTDLIKAAENADMELISITDHNVLGFHRELSELKIKTKVEILAGIELDCCFNSRNFHLIGYNFNIFSNDFDNWQKEFTKREMDATPLRIEKLQELGFIIDKETVYERAKNAIPQEELMAEIILENETNHKHPKIKPYLPGGERSEMPLINFFWDFFSHGKPAHIPVEYLDIKEGISMIKDNGGKTVLAHPGANFKNDIELIDKIIKHGIDGIEAVSTYHSPEKTNMFISYAAKNNILITCGSDFHGKNKPLIKIGGFESYNQENKIMNLFK